MSKSQWLVVVSRLSEWSLVQLGVGRAIGFLISLNGSYKCKTSPRISPFHSSGRQARRHRASPSTASWAFLQSCQLVPPWSPGRLAFTPSLPHFLPFYLVLQGPICLDFTCSLSAVYCGPSTSFHAIHTSLAAVMDLRFYFRFLEA